MFMSQNIFFISQSGGAIHVSLNSRLDVSQCEWISNVATLQGGALSSRSSAVTIQDSTFSDNRAVSTTAGVGGWSFFFCFVLSQIFFDFLNNIMLFLGALAFLTGTLDVARCTFENNTAYQGGVAYCLGGETFTMRDSTYVNNYASDSGGVFRGIACR